MSVEPQVVVQWSSKSSFTGREVTCHMKQCSDSVQTDTDDWNFFKNFDRLICISQALYWLRCQLSSHSWHEASTNSISCAVIIAIEMQLSADPWSESDFYWMIWKYMVFVLVMATKISWSKWYRGHVLAFIIVASIDHSFFIFSITFFCLEE